MVNWFVNEAAKNADNATGEENKYFSLQDGKNVLTIDANNPPLKRSKEFDNDGQKTVRCYHDFALLGVNQGKVLSATDFLYGRIVQELADNAEMMVNATEATLEIRKSHPLPDKTNWEVILRSAK